MKYIISFCLVISLLVAPAAKLWSQECEVGVEALKGKYEGGCKNGKADGTGKATGTDMYEGEFKSGLPQGLGSYAWANGDLYDGRWQKGKKDGSGTMHYKTAGGDSAISGFWKRDEYIGLYEHPYEIISKGIASTLDITHNKDAGRNEVNLTVSQVQNQYAPVTQPVLVFVNAIDGFYSERVDNTSVSTKNNYSFKQVSFPFRAVFSFGARREVEIQFFDPGSYEVRIVYIN